MHAKNLDNAFLIQRISKWQIYIYCSATQSGHDGLLVLYEAIRPLMFERQGRETVQSDIFSWIILSALYYNRVCISPFEL